MIAVVASAPALLLGVAVGGSLAPGSTGWAAALMALFFSLSFFFSGSETALFSLQRVDRQRLETAGPLGRWILVLLERRRSLITSLLIGNESVNVALGAFGAALFATLVPQAPWLNILVITPLLVLFSEITPKVIAYRFNVQWARAAVIPLRVFYWAVSPVRIVVSGIVAVMGRAFRVTGENRPDVLQEEEIRHLIEEGADMDVREREIIEAVFDFDEHTVARLMTPRPELFAVPTTIPWDDLLVRCRDAGFSRVPVYDKRPEDIVGVLLLKDLLRYKDAPPAGPTQFRSLLLPPVFVPQSKRADAMLREFLAKKFHMAFVVDEHGTLLGIVTLDDLLAELVGELLDIDDESEEAIAQIQPGAFAVKAWMDVEDFTEETGIALPEGDYHTVGGFVFHQLGHLPAKGDEFVWDKHRFTVGMMEGRRLTEVRVTTLASESTTGQAAG